jgi:type 1 fimbria pilin
VLPDDFHDLGYRFSINLNGCAKQAGGHLGLGTVLLRAVNPSAFNDLSNMGKGTNFGIHGNDSDISNLIPAVATL